MKNIALMIAASLLTLLTGCSSLPKADADWNPDFDFSKVHTYSFVDRAKLRADTPMTSDITRNRIESAVEKTLNLKGLRYEKDPAAAHLQVSYHVTAKDKQDIQTYNTGVNYCYRCGYGMGMSMGTTDVRVREYTEGTLIIDMVDPKSNQSVWRGHLSAKISDLKSQQERIEAINYAVTTILAQFPPMPEQASK